MERSTNAPGEPWSDAKSVWRIVGTDTWPTVCYCFVADHAVGLQEFRIRAVEIQADAPAVATQREEQLVRQSPPSWQA